MDAAYRQKLKHWLLSMLTLLMIVANGLAALWFFRLGRFLKMTGHLDISNIAGPIGEFVIVYAQGFAIAAFWLIAAP